MLKIKTQTLPISTPLSFPYLQSLIIQLTNLISITADTAQNKDYLSILYCNRGVLYYQSLSKSNNNNNNNNNNSNRSVNVNNSGSKYGNSSVGNSYESNNSGGGNMGNHQWAHADFQKAIEFNYLNYAAYFNMFSVNFVEKKYAQGLKNLCCSLSCLYLIRGKQNSNQTDINKCIKLTQNNCQGRLLKALHYKKKGKHSLALNQINWILQLEPHNLQILHIKNYIQSLARPSNQNRYNNLANSQQQQQLQKPKSNNINAQQQSQLISNQMNDNKSVQQNHSRRLTCTLYDDYQHNQNQNSYENNNNFDYFQETVKRLVEFNQLYYDVVGDRSTRHRGQRFNIFMIRDYRAILQGAQNYIQDVKQQQQQNQVREYQGQGYIQMNQNVISSFQNKINLPLVGANLQQSVGSLLINSSNIALLPSHSPTPAIKPILNHSAQIGSLSASVSAQIQNLSPTQSQNTDNIYLQKSDNYSMKKSTSQAMSASNNSFITIKAKDQINKKIQIKILSLQINGKQIQNLDETGIYCTYQYGENKVILIKSIQVDDQQQQKQKEDKKCQQGKRLVIKLYQKQIHAFKDKFLGKGEIQINKSNIYNIEMQDKQLNKVGLVKLVVETV